MSKSGSTEEFDRRGYLRLLSVAVPLAGLAVLYPIRAWILHTRSVMVADAATGLLMAIGVVAFSWTIFGIIDRQDRDLARQHRKLAQQYDVEHRLRGQLEALHESSLALSSAHTGEQALQRLVDLARELIGARYAALGVLGPHGAIDAFYTAGITPEERKQLGTAPRGHGLLGVILAEGTSLRVADIARDPRSVGFPAGHPHMTNLLGVPVAHGGKVAGNLYLADKVGADLFDSEDERLLTQLASHAAVIIENARLAERVRTLAVAAERHRIGKDLRDGVIQTLYAVNLELEDAAEDIEANPESVRSRIDRAIDRLGQVMIEMRRYIVGLQAASEEDRPLRETVAAILADAQSQAMIEPQLCIDDRADDVPPGLKQELSHIVREAVANVLRHAHANHIDVLLEIEADKIHLRITDDGVGFDPARQLAEKHAGIDQMRTQMLEYGGTLTVQSAPGQGTAIDVWAPIATPQRESVNV